MKNKKALIIGILIAAAIIIILLCNFFNTNLSQKTGELIGDAVGNIDFSANKTVRGSKDDPHSNINKLLNADKDFKIEVPEIETVEMDSDFSIKYTDVNGDKLEYKDISDSARQFFAYDSFSGIYVLNVLGRVCKENSIDLSTMMFGETIVPEDSNYDAVYFESNRYRVTIFYNDSWEDANVKVELIG